ncbi:MAG: Long-chain-fatty-acid--CoA ligase [uncultured Rubrobacteraceae bacterium]|uniref:Long-chain-fatty-acid--CoA ligase n=1 Tax=uncultured Rubrobacteraceae bacterium TaxID=349277 RepID=A0A6J4PM45_9ACTN|nr:MAG: Long-chain-fatty-acid--CoA ligase [uncultured Rubrobacteraceae bacterium]
MTELTSAERIAPGAIEAWQRHLGREVDAGALRTELVEGTLPRAVRETAARVPERPALAVDDEAATHGELDRLAAGVGGWLRAQGLAAEERVILCGGNSLNFVIAYLGILRAGCVVVPAGAGLTGPELRHIVEDCGATCALAQGDALDRLTSISRDGSSLHTVVAFGGEGSSGTPPLQEVISESEPLEPGDESGDDLAMLAYTSGTTGWPKGVPLTHANLLSSVRAAMRAWRWDANDTLVHALPFSHQHGLGGVHMTLLAGSRAVVHSRFDPARLCAAIESEGATVLFAVPAIYEKLATWEGIEEADFSSLRLPVAGSSALSPTLARRVSSLLGSVLERYGSTESGLSVSNPYDGSRKFGSVGFPLPGTELSIVDEEGHALEPGDDGEIVLRGPQVFSGYWNLPEATEENFYPGGWFRTGDVGRVDPEDGYLTITGRLKEMIISGGLNIYPREVELVLEDHATVEGAAVVGVPSERWGEEVVAFVVPVGDDRVDEEDLSAHARENLSAYKCPKRFFVVDELPRNEMGKVLKDELVRMAAEERETG